MRQITAKEYCHELLGDGFADALCSYDTSRRVDTLVDEFLLPHGIRGKRVLDVGCGLGFFSERLTAHGAQVIASDVGPGLVARTHKRVGCQAVIADALNLVEQFGENAFEMIISSECIEHTPDPKLAIQQMAGVLKPGGLLSISTPNVVWQPAVKVATWLRLRPFDGYENFSTWRGMRRAFRDCRLEVVQERGLHLFPFHFGFHRVSRWLDYRAQGMRGIMINVCMLGRKQP